jgi:hypothetical protein
MREYITHNHTAVHQSMQFQKCKAKLRPGDIMMVWDFAMDYSHHHQNGLQRDNWGVWRTTLLPVAIYRVGADGQLKLDIFYSDDLNHSNKMVQYCLEKVVRHYQGVLEADGQNLRRVFIWSDGCAAQFKSRHMITYEVVQSLHLSYETRDGRKVPSPKTQHHFFASCHGKNLSDALSGMIKRDGVSWYLL